MCTPMRSRRKVVSDEGREVESAVLPVDDVVAGAEVRAGHAGDVEPAWRGNGHVAIVAVERAAEKPAPHRPPGIFYPPAPGLCDQLRDLDFVPLAGLAGGWQVVGIGADAKDPGLAAGLQLRAVQGVFLRGRVSGQEGEGYQGDEAGAHGAPIRCAAGRDPPGWEQAIITKAQTVGAMIPRSPRLRFSTCLTAPWEPGRGRTLTGGAFRARRR